MSLLQNTMAKSGGDFYNGVATQSLRFDDGSSAYLTRTPDSASNRKTWTWSGWYKLGNLGLLSDLFNAGPSGTDRVEIHTYLNQLTLYMNTSGTASEVVASPLLRDPSAWYHFVVACDTTQATSSNRVKLYINGNLQSLSTASYPPQDFTSGANNTTVNVLGRRNYGTDRYLDGYLSEVNFIDGLALTPTSFGETKNSAWIPVDTSGLTFGTNGFRLKFDQVGVGTASTSTIGADTSGNTNHFTSSGIVASDCAMPDSPENNFTTLNPLMNYGESSRVVSEGNLKFSDSTNNSTYARIGANLPTQGKWYWEVLISGTLSSYLFTNGTFDIEDNNNIVSGSTNSTELTGCHGIRENGKYYDNGSLTASYASFSSGDILQVYFDADIGSLFMGRNNTAFNSGSAVATSLPEQEIHCSVAQNDSFSLYNFGQDSSFAGNKTAQGNTDGNGIGDFFYTPPSGFLALCTANLLEPTIGANSDTQATDHFGISLYSGDNSVLSISDLAFQPDWVWIKRRNADGHQNMVQDSSRGPTAYFYTDATSVESTDTDRDWFRSFDDDGFTVSRSTTGGQTTSEWNTSGGTYVGWSWKANGGTTVTNEAGSIDSTVQANTTSGFSIVLYTGNGSAGATYGHGLGAVPAMIITKGRNVTDNWMTRHKDYSSNTTFIELNTVNAEGNATDVWNNTAPTSSVISVGTGGTVNTDTKLYISYCFIEVEGFSKFGSYTGNSSDDGAFVFLGFKPAWVMIKSSSVTGAFTSWTIYDNKRKTFNDDVGDNSNPLYANKNVKEGERGNGTSDISGNANSLDFLSNGFKCRDNADEINQSNTYIYMAFAEAPFKYANAE